MLGQRLNSVILKVSSNLGDSVKCFVVVGSHILFGKPDPSEGFTAHFCSFFCIFLKLLFRLVSLCAPLFFLILGYFYSFPGLHFLLCILFLLSNFLSAAHDAPLRPRVGSHQGAC